MKDKTIQQFTNYGTVNQLNLGAGATLIYNECGKGETVFREVPGIVDVEDTPLSEPEQALAHYVHDAGRLADIVQQLREAVTAHDIAFRVVAGMEDLPTITPYLVVKACFIQPLIDLAVNVTQGRSINNVREQINKMLAKNKWKK